MDTPLTIFIVDDNPVDVSLVRWVLDAQQLPYDLQVIENGDYVLDVFEHLAQQEQLRSPSIVLLDLNLPQLDGKEVLRHVKASPQGSDIRVVVVTSSTNPADQHETLALGADAYFVKPYHLNEFMQLGEVIKHVAFDHVPACRQHDEQVSPLSPCVSDGEHLSFDHREARSMQDHHEAPPWRRQRNELKRKIPQRGAAYWYLSNSLLDIHRAQWDDDGTDEGRWHVGNVFLSLEQAEHARDKITEVLRTMHQDHT
jgi:two-component system response regulator